MHKRILKKLNSRRGASLTFALLLFLVCAAVGSVVLTSATATAGRVSENYDYDQRYYAVTSAAELLRETLGGQSRQVTVQKQTTRTITTVADFDANGEPLGAPAKTFSPDTVSYSDIGLLNGSNAIPVNSTNLIDQALTKLVDTVTTGIVSPTVTKEEALFNSRSLKFDTTVNEPTKTFDLTVTGSGLSDAAKNGLSVTITQTLRRDGSLVFLIENSSGTDRYRLQLTLAADISLSTKTSELNTSGTPIPSTPEHGGVTATTQKTTQQLIETQTYVVKWDVTSITTV